MTGWPEGTVADLADIVMGQSPPGDACNSKAVGIPLLNGPTEFGLISPVPVQYTTDSKREARRNDILFCVRGSTTGRMNWADQPYSIGRGLAAIRHKKGEKYRHYLKGIIDYYLPHLLTAATGSTFPNVSKDQILGLKVPLPSLTEQEAIADMLASISDKIELNQQMNETLEAMTRALFKSWFVDFDPVRAKAEGCEPEGMDVATAALFPAAFNDDGLPEGWGQKLVGDAVDTISKTYPLKTVSNVIFLNTGDIQDGKFLHTNKSDAASLPGQAKKSIQKYDILYSEIRPENKRYAFVYFDAPEYVVSTKLMVLRASSDIPSLFVYFVLTQQSNIDWLQMMAESRSGTFPQITYDVLSRVSYISPTDNKIISIFTERVLEPFYKKMIANDKECEQLAALRDTLLPKLISGELRVDEAAPVRKEAVG